MNLLHKSKAFTLIELVMVIVIIGILSAVAVPKFINMRDQANEAAEKGVIGGVRSAVAVWHANQMLVDTTPDWPTMLDAWGAGSAGTDKPFFDSVLQTGITDEEWASDGSGAYTGPNSGTYTYNSADGSFKGF